MTIRLVNDNGGNFHEDIHVSIPELDIDTYVDSYYFALDSGILPEEETHEKVRIVLIDLLRNWLKNLNGLTDNRTIYLPYDFSDEYLGGIAVTLNKDIVSLQYCLERKLGGAYPTFVKSWQSREGQIRTIGIKNHVPLVQFITDVESEIECA